MEKQDVQIGDADKTDTDKHEENVAAGSDVPVTQGSSAQELGKFRDKFL